MPNWCDNAVTLRHSDKSKIDALNDVLEQKGEFFNSVRPNPAGEWQYDWSLTNWGTKWEAGIIDFQRQDDNEIWISFESAWSPPIAFYEYLHEQGWEVEGWYHESGCAFAGIWKDGVDDFHEYDFNDLESLEALPGDLQDFTGLIDYYHEQQAEREQEDPNETEVD